MDSKATCQDGQQRTVHGVAGSQYVYANGRRVYGYTIHNGIGLGARFIAASTSKYRALVGGAVSVPVEQQLASASV
jgi:hypothetical protein